MLKLKLQYFGHLIQRTDPLEKTDAGKDSRREEKGTTEDEMVGWHHWLNGHEFEQALGVGDGHGSMVCHSPWGCKELDTTEWTELNYRWASQVALVIKRLPANTEYIRDTGSVSGLGRSPGWQHGNPLQYSCLESPMDKEAWQATVHRVAQSRT